ncbi:MAG: hypothetical protein K8F25_12630 [Fimbriimonadaceae bacterium]|nr:hypothetical protein [Alphaproteobacteria bacterium]
MKEQYIGDVSDYRKYALLRALARESGLQIGVCWMMTPPDGRADGNKMGYLDRPEAWRKYDPDLFDGLYSLTANETAPTIVEVEDLKPLDTFSYFNNIIPDSEIGRDLYFERMKASLSDADLIFFDPDNGLDVSSVTRGRKNSSKYIYRDEIRDCLSAGKSALVYQHYPREERSAFERRVANELFDQTNGVDVWAFRTAHVVFFLVIAPSHKSVLDIAAQKISSNLNSEFLTGAQLVSGS